MSRTRLIEIFLEVARIDGLSGRERDVADRVVGFLSDLGLKPVESAPVGAGDTGNVVCPVAGGGDLALLAHLDTARPTRELRPRQLDDRLTSDGRTVLGVDNRLGVALLLQAAERAAGDGGGAGFTLAFTVQEETTLAGGAALSLPPQVESAVVLDSSLRPGALIDRAYGARRFEVEVRGRAAHSGLAPERGVNAIAVAARAVAGLPIGRIDEETTLNVARIDGGGPINVVPDRVVLLGEVRALDRERVDAEIERVRGRFVDTAREAGATVGFESDWDFLPYRHPPGDPLRRRVERAISAAGLEPRGAVSAGGSDANTLNGRGIPTINLGIGAQNPHGDDEFVLFEDLDADSRIVAALTGA